MTEPAAALPMGETVTMALDTIKPYWRNPRRVPEEAVNALVASIEKYGYQQPIVVDTAGVIIIGHTRYAAVRKIGYEQVPVLVVDLPAQRARELRIIDNRTPEFTSWDYDALVKELAGFDASLRESFFPEISVDSMDDAAAFDALSTLPSTEPWEAVVSEVTFTCTHCFHSWSQEVTREEIMAGRLSMPPEKEETS